MDRVFIGLLLGLLSAGLLKGFAETFRASDLITYIVFFVVYACLVVFAWRAATVRSALSRMLVVFGLLLTFSPTILYYGPESGHSESSAAFGLSLLAFGFVIGPIFLLLGLLAKGRPRSD